MHCNLKATQSFATSSGLFLAKFVGLLRMRTNCYIAFDQNSDIANRH